MIEFKRLFFLGFLIYGSILYGQKKEDKNTLQLIIINKKDSIITNKNEYLKKINLSNVISITIVNDSIVISKTNIKHIDAIINIELAKK